MSGDMIFVEFVSGYFVWIEWLDGKVNSVLVLNFNVLIEVKVIDK